MTASTLRAWSNQRLGQFSQSWSHIMVKYWVTSLHKDPPHKPNILWSNQPEPCLVALALVALAAS